MTTTTTAAWSPPRRRVGRVATPLLAATLVTLPAVAATLSGHLSLTGLAAVFLVALSVALLAATLGLRLIHLVDGPSRTHHGSATNRPHAQAAASPSGTPLGRVPVARIPADQAIDGSHPRRAAASPAAQTTAAQTTASLPTSQDNDMHRSAPTSGSLR